jgi:hypothetical protein
MPLDDLFTRRSPIILAGSFGLPAAHDSDMDNIGGNRNYLRGKMKIIPAFGKRVRADGQSRRL